LETQSGLHIQHGTEILEAKVASLVLNPQKHFL
jgi:hypothetical protein